MPHARYFIDNDLKLNQNLHLSSEEEKHLIKVMRTKPQDIVEIINGKGLLAKAVLQENNSLKVESVHVEPTPEIEIIIAQAIPKLNKLDYITEKCCELGAFKIWFFPGENSEKCDISKTLEKRLENITISALKQCGRLFKPSIEIKPPLKNWQNTLEYPSYFGSLEPQAVSFAKAWDKKSLIFFIGPEKGFTINEKNILTKLGSKGVKLSPNILRTETAAICMLSIAGHLQL
jgi:16S rRNA (uracil1498-N3)-methyltransferase